MSLCVCVCAPGLTGFTWVSMFLSVVIASERCLCVVSPLRAQRMQTDTMGFWVTACCLVLLAGMLVIAGPKHTVACIFDPATNTTSDIVYVTKYGHVRCIAPSKHVSYKLDSL